MSRPTRAAFGLLLVLAFAAGSAAPAKASGPATWKSRIAAAERYAHERAGTISFAVVDEAGRLHGYHARAVAPSASVLKAMLLVAYLRRSDVRDRALQQWERDLLAPMIRRSDNVAATRMVGLVGKARLDDLARRAEMEHFELNWPIWGQSEITPRGQALFFDRIDKLVPPRHRRYAMRLLATVVASQRWGVGRVPHPGWHLYFKGGWGSGTGLVDHQVALYATGHERFSLALFTRFDPDHEYGKETLRGLAARLLKGVASPGRRVPLASRASLGRHAVVMADADCSKVTIRPHGGTTRAYSTGAASCEGLRLVSGDLRALWGWPEAGVKRLATADYGSPATVDLGDFDASDPLGPLAASGGILAFAHGSKVSAVGGPTCPETASALGTGGGRVAAGSGTTIQVLKPATCQIVRLMGATGTVTATALDDEVVASLSRGNAGRLWLEWFRISTGSRLGKREVGEGTVPSLSIHSPWILYRTPRAFRVVATPSGRAWTVWRPARPELGARLLGRNVAWVERDGSQTRLWSLRLPVGD